MFKTEELDWEEFYKKYPDSGGFIGISPVGFNRERNQALIYLEHSCRSLCGSGHYILLSKNKEDWKVDKNLWLEFPNLIYKTKRLLQNCCNEPPARLNNFNLLLRRFNFRAAASASD